MIQGTIVALAALATCQFAAIPWATGSLSISEPEFDALHKMITPHPGESQYREIDWLTSVWEARRMAAADVLYSSASGSHVRELVLPEPSTERAFKPDWPARRPNWRKAIYRTLPANDVSGGSP